MIENKMEYATNDVTAGIKNAVRYKPLNFSSLLFKITANISPNKIIIGTWKMKMINVLNKAL